MTSRNILVAVDDTDASQVMCNWVLDNELQPEDKVHLLHVMLKDTAPGGNLPGGDYFMQAHPQEAHRVVMAMLQQRYLNDIEQLGITPVVHVVQSSLDPKTVGRIICSKAEDLQCQRVYVAAHGHHHSKLMHMLSATVPQYCKQHCKVPLTIVTQAEDKDVVSEVVQPAV